MALFSDITGAEEIIRQVKNGDFPNRNTAYRFLVEIVNQFRGQPIADEAEYLINTYYADQKYR